MRGLGLPTKKYLTKQTIKSSVINYLQETKLCQLSPLTLKSIYGSNYDGFHYLAPEGSAGGLFTAWNQNEVDGRPYLSGHFTLSPEFSSKNSATKFIITNINGPYEHSSREAFFSELHDIDCSSHLPWALIGDFNATRFHSKRAGTIESSSFLQLFNEFIFSLGLIKINLSSCRFTWSNFREQSSLAKLDRCLVSLNWHSSFFTSSLSLLPRITLDHILLLF